MAPRARFVLVGGGLLAAAIYGLYLQRSAPFLSPVNAIMAISFWSIGAWLGSKRRVFLAIIRQRKDSHTLNHSWLGALIASSGFYLLFVVMVFESQHWLVLVDASAVALTVLYGFAKYNCWLRGCCYQRKLPDRLLLRRVIIFRGLPWAEMWLCMALAVVALGFSTAIETEGGVAIFLFGAHVTILVYSRQLQNKKLVAKFIVK